MCFSCLLVQKHSAKYLHMPVTLLRIECFSGVQKESFATTAGCTPQVHKLLLHSTSELTHYTLHSLHATHCTVHTPAKVVPSGLK